MVVRLQVRITPPTAMTAQTCRDLSESGLSTEDLQQQLDVQIPAVLAATADRGQRVIPCVLV